MKFVLLTVHLACVPNTETCEKDSENCEIIFPIFNLFNMSNKAFPKSEAEEMYVWPNYLELAC